MFIFLSVYVTIFLYRSKDFVSERSNKLNESLLLELVTHYKVKTIIVDDSLADLNLMNHITSITVTTTLDSFRKLYEKDCLGTVKVCEVKMNVLWISNRNKIDFLIKEKSIHNLLISNKTRIIDLIDDSGSKVEIDFSNRTNNGRNNLFISLVENDYKK